MKNIVKGLVVSFFASLATAAWADCTQDSPCDIRGFIDDTSTPLEDSIVWHAASALVKNIKEDPNNNHVPIPGHAAYRNLRLVSVGQDYSGFVIVDRENGTMTVEISKVSFQASGVPLFSNYAADVSFKADFSLGTCTFIDGSRDYRILKSNASLVDTLFKNDLTGKGYTKYAYADAVFATIFAESESLSRLCVTGL